MNDIIFISVTLLSNENGGYFSPRYGRNMTPEVLLRFDPAAVRRNVAKMYSDPRYYERGTAYADKKVVSFVSVKI